MSADEFLRPRPLQLAGGKLVTSNSFVVLKDNTRPSTRPGGRPPGGPALGRLDVRFQPPGPGERMTV